MVLTVLLALVSFKAVLAQNEMSDAVFEDLAETWSQTLDAVERDLSNTTLTDKEIQPLREQAQLVKRWALKIRSRAQTRADEAARLLRALGPAPGDDGPAEDPGVAEERSQINDRLTRFQGRVKKINLVVARADSLMAATAQAEFSILARMLGQRIHSPLDSSIVKRAVSDLPERIGKTTSALSRWWHETDIGTRWTSDLTWIFALLAITITAFFPARSTLLRKFGPDPSATSPNLRRRVVAITAQTCVNVIIPVLIIVALHAAVVQSAGFTPDVKRLLDSVTKSSLLLVIIIGVAFAALSPRMPAWRITHFTDSAALSLYRAARLWAATSALIDVALSVLIQPDAGPLPRTLLQIDTVSDDITAVSIMIGVIIGGLTLLNVLRSRNWRFMETSESGEEVVRPPNAASRWLFFLAKAGIVAAMILGGLGYLNFAIFLISRIIQSLLIIGLALLIRYLIAETLSQLASGESHTGGAVRGRFSLDAGAMERIVFWLTLTVDVILTITAATLLLLVWGVHAADLRAAAYGLAQGIDVGSFRLSPVDVVAALAVFLLLLVIIRLFQRFLSTRVLSHAVVDVGVRDALTAGVGYVGIVIAVLVSVSLLGLEMSRLAIIFGALSVGIGFGLQHVVNNFVSGLILLMQRPIKAGDWIVVGQHEGHVKHVNVISTEIETFDHASVIVPNSNLVTTDVLNWMHKSRLGRVVLPVGVSYASDPDQVRDVLLACADRNENILRRPAPSVIFKNFGTSSLDFDLRFYLRDIDQRLNVSSDLRFAIVKAFREQGIEIPFPQQDLHVRDVDPNLLDRLTPGTADGT